jgi:hypothetical protein
MAEIKIEPRPRRSALPFLIGMLLVAAIAVGVWYFLGRGAGMAEGVDPVAPPAATTPGTTGG